MGTECAWDPVSSSWLPASRDADAAVQVWDKRRVASVAQRIAFAAGYAAAKALHAGEDTPPADSKPEPSARERAKACADKAREWADKADRSNRADVTSHAIYSAIHSIDAICTALDALTSDEAGSSEWEAPYEWDKHSQAGSSETPLGTSNYPESRSFETWGEGPSTRAEGPRWSYTQLCDDGQWQWNGEEQRWTFTAWRKL